MRTINIAIIEKSPMARVALDDFLTRGGFNIAFNVASINQLLLKRTEESIDAPDICLLDTNAKSVSIDILRRYYPGIKIVAYDPIGSQKERVIRNSRKFDAHISKSVKISEWIGILRNVVSLPDYSTVK